VSTESLSSGTGLTSRSGVARGGSGGPANEAYLRHGRFFVLLASHGEHPFFEHEGRVVKDSRGVPIKFGSYAIGVRGAAKGTACCGSKFALRGTTECWRAELRQYNIRVMLVNPARCSRISISRSRVTRT
jgi:NAD(P)-dependent dehydrogenase (short-subunit alcohol dehydrogenase family)